MSDEHSDSASGVDERAEVIGAIRALADFLEQNPGVRAPGWVSAHTYVRLDEDPIGVPELQAVGGEVKVSGPYVEAERDFGAGVTYKAQAKASDICVEREVTKSEFVLPEDLQPPAPESDLAPVDTAAVTW